MILAIDTATRWTGLALYDGTAVLAEAGWRSLQNQTVELAPAIAQMLQRAGLAPSDLDGIAISIGPGSYTGLRVGLGVAKGLALANQTPLVGVPTLDVIAHGFGPLEEPLLAVVEAGRSRVCAAVYAWQGRQGWQPQGAPVIESWQNLLPTIAGPMLFAGEISAAAAKQIRTASKAFRLASPAAATRRPACLAELGWLRLRKGAAANARTLAPLYLKDPAGK